MKRLLFSIVMAFSLVPSAWAQKDGAQATRWSVGGLIGYEIWEDRGGVSDNRIGFGLSADYRVIPNWNVGAYFILGPKSQEGVDHLAMFYGLQAGYDLAQVASGFSAGARVGLLTNTTQVADLPSVSNTELAFGPRVAWDFPVSTSVTVGPDVSWLLIMSDPTTWVLNALAAVKYSF